MTGPTRLFLEITTECNLHCRLCHLWANTDSPAKLATAEKITFLTDLADWLQDVQNIDSRNFSIVFTGGEPFLYKDEILALASTCQELGFCSFVNSNGTLLGPIIPDIVRSGLTAITISLDSYLVPIHDDLRGVPGTFSRATHNVQGMLREKAEIGSHINVFLQSILGKWNIGEIEAQVRWAETLGVAGIMFQCLQYPFGLPIPSEWQMNFPDFPSLDAVDNAIQTALMLKTEGAPIVNSEEEILWWRTYFANPEFFPSGFSPCMAGAQNLIIDILGNAKFCFNKMITPPDRVGNIRTRNLSELWEGPSAMDVKGEMAQCHRSCGVMVCHCDSSIRESAPLGGN